MTEDEALAEQFEANRTHLRAVAYRMLGSLSEAEDAVQEAWLHASRAGSGNVDNLRGWLTTIVSRVCLDALRSRRSRREDSLEFHMPDPIVTAEPRLEPENEALLADSVGIALMVVLEALPPPERLAFVLHDMFAVPFEEIGEIVGRTPAAARQLASRARRRVQGEAKLPDTDFARQRRVVDAFFAAARDGNFEALVAVLHPDVVLRSDAGVLRPAASFVRRGAEVVASGAATYAGLAQWVRPAIVNGAAGVVVMPHGRPFSVIAFTVQDGLIVGIDALSDPDRLARMDLSAFV